MREDVQINDILIQAAEFLVERMYPNPLPREELSKKYTMSDECGKRILSYKNIIQSCRERKVLKTIFVIAAIISVLVAFALCMAAHEKKLNFMTVSNVTYGDGSSYFTRIIGEDPNEESYCDNCIKFAVPEGFTIDSSYRGNSNEYRYVNGERYFFCVQSDFCTTYVVDSENFSLNQIQINDSIVYYYEDEQEDYVFLTAQDKDAGYIVRGNITLEEGIEILIDILQ